ncbi:CD209 antigen-like [Cyprinodon tularosa]|uniref:CD209 antigen-like n=1 Tax=Cyprinodon tularosa TaxID=77115 RepID=UPI0018E2358F|nr:CD209 antigen-like [Cyprinodon tularosa]
MSEEEIHYASVVFKSKKPQQTKPAKEEETIYDEVKLQNDPTQQTSGSKAGILSEKEAGRKHGCCQMLTCFLVTFSIILVLGIIATVYFFSFHDMKINQLRANKAENKNLTALNNKLRSENQNLTYQNENLTHVYNDLETRIRNLTVEQEQLKNKTQDLKRQTDELEGRQNDLKEQIENLKKTQNELNVSRAQWSIDEYCPKATKGRKCKPCQKGWSTFTTSCYAYNNAKVENQRNWNGAREGCREKGSDLTAAANEEEKGYINGISPKEEGIKGYWIGLRADQGKWKWIDGTELSNQDWIEGKATDGQCVTALQDEQWRSVSCKEKNAWICEKKALKETAESDYPQVAAGAEMKMRATPVHSNLMRELHQVKKQNHEFEGEKETLKEQIEKLKETQNELNVSRAQWSIDEYCPKRTNGRKCLPCQEGWNQFQTNCYGYNDADERDRKNWTEARENSTGKVSDLTVVETDVEKSKINNTFSPAINGIAGYWIGLRADQGKWKWINGAELINTSWIKHNATDGQCVTVLEDREWRSVSCDEKNAWICKKKALTVK